MTDRVLLQEICDERDKAEKELDQAVESSSAEQAKFWLGKKRAFDEVLEMMQDA